MPIRAGALPSTVLHTKGVWTGAPGADVRTAAHIERLARHPPVRREPRPFLLAILLITAFVTLAMPRPVAACSCASPDIILEAAPDDPSTAVFTAVTGPSVGAETSLSVTRWFQGGIPRPFLVLDVNVGDGAGCGTSTPPAGKEYLFAIPLEGNRGSLSLCSPMVDLGTAEGQQMLAMARQLGPEVVPSAAAPPAVENPSPSPGAADPTTSGLFVSLLGAVAPLAVAVAFGIGLIGGLVLILRRRERSSGD